MSRAHCAVIYALIASQIDASFTDKTDALLSLSDLDVAAADFSSFSTWWTDDFENLSESWHNQCEVFNDFQASPVSADGEFDDSYYEKICPADKDPSAEGTPELFTISNTNTPDYCWAEAGAGELLYALCDSGSTKMYWYTKEDGAGNTYLVSYQKDLLVMLDSDTRSMGEGDCEDSLGVQGMWNDTGNVPYGSEYDRAKHYITIQDGSSGGKVLSNTQEFVEGGTTFTSTVYLSQSIEVHEASYLAEGSYTEVFTEFCGTPDTAGTWVFTTVDPSSNVGGGGDDDDGDDDGDGSCFRGDSQVQVLNSRTRGHEWRPLTQVKAGDKVLAIDHTHKPIYSTVVALPRRKAVAGEEFLEVTLRDHKRSPTANKAFKAKQQGAATAAASLARSLGVTEHHTFPTCHGRGGTLGASTALTEAHRLKPGDCLHAENGEKRIIESVARVAAKAGSDHVYTVQLEGSAARLVVDGVVTSAKPSITVVPTAQSQTPSKSKTANRFPSSSRKTITSWRQVAEASKASLEQKLLDSNKKAPAQAAANSKSWNKADRARQHRNGRRRRALSSSSQSSSRAPSFLRGGGGGNGGARALSAITVEQDECDETCAGMDPSCAKYASQCQWSASTPNIIALCPFPAPDYVTTTLGLEACYTDVIVHNAFEGEEYRLCGCRSNSYAEGTPACTWDLAVNGRLDPDSGACTSDFTGCEVNWSDCEEFQDEPQADWLYADFLAGTQTFEEAWLDSASGTSQMADMALTAPVLYGAYFALPEETTSGIISRPMLLGSESTFELNGTAGVTEVIFTNVVVESGSKVNFNAGSAVVIGGNNAGTLFASTTDPIKLTKLTNSGQVSFEGNTAGGVLITDTTNAASGVVHLSASTASVHGVVNSGTVHLDGGQYVYSGGSNQGTINVDGGATATYVADNGGDLNMVSGTADATVALNSGTINISAGATGTLTVADNSGTIVIASGAVGTVTITGSNTGTVIYNGGRVDSSFTDGVVTIVLP